MTTFGITQRERAGWQRRAAAELTAVLDAHRDLSVITWTVGPVGATLVGHVTGPVGTRVREDFEAWAAALTLDEHRRTPGGTGSVFLRAATSRNNVRLGLTATLFDPES